jgi:hypothetical protein
MEAVAPNLPRYERIVGISLPLRDTLRVLMAPERITSLDRFIAERDAIEQEHGAAVAALWMDAQTFIGLRGKVKSPPTGWSFVPAMQSMEIGIKPELDLNQMLEWRAFWNWYGPLEYHLIKLIRTIRALHSIRPAMEPLFFEICRVAFPILDQYQTWIKDRKIAWLPRNRVPGTDRNIIERLGKVLIDYDTGPAPEIEPYP